MGLLVLGFQLLNFSSAVQNPMGPACVVAGSIILILGLVDDYLELTSRSKIIVQMLAIGIWLTLTPSTDLMMVKIGLPVSLSKALTAFWILGIVNAFNMLDGLDGLATGISIITAVTLATFTSGVTQTTMMIVAGSCLGFLTFNWRPAKIYLGDTGSLFLGFTLATSAATISLGSGHMASRHLVLIPLFLFCIPQMDALLAIARRLRAKTPVSMGDREHLHHKLQRLGLSVEQTVFVFYATSVYASLSAITISHLDGWLEIGLVSALTASGLLVVLLAVYFCEVRLATLRASVAKSHWDRELRLQNLSALPPNFHATVYDLMPYYKEFRTEQISKLENFARDFASNARSQHSGASFSVQHDHRLVVVSEAPIDQDVCAEAFNRILVRYGLERGQKSMPAGLSFYDGQSKGEDFAQKFIGKYQQDQAYDKLSKNRFTA